MSSENKALLRRWFDEVWVKGRVDAVDEMLARNAVIHGLGPEPQGPEEFKRFHALYSSAFPDVTIHVDDILAEGNLVAARWSGTGTHREKVSALRPRACQFGSAAWSSCGSRMECSRKAGISSTSSASSSNSAW